MDEQQDDDHHSRARSYLASTCTRQGEQSRYVIKMIQKSSRKKAEAFVQSVMDIALEARYLAVLKHPHIIRMRAMSSYSPFLTGQTFFSVLDKLKTILSTRLLSWKKQIPNHFLFCCFVEEPKDFWIERMLVAYFLSSALSYLHKAKIVYRDLKPDNVGFDFRGDVKLFDFGLARELQRKLLTNEGTFLLTGGTGFPPYMAPEVALHKPYNESCDVYSFSMLLWQVLKVEVPFGAELDERVFLNVVVKGGARPVVETRWPDVIKQCIELGWSKNIRERPSMSCVSEILHSNIVDEINPEEEDLLRILRLFEKKYN